MADNARILVVDDSPSVRDIIMRSLQQVGYGDVRGAASVAEARERIATEGPFDLVILDIRMPGQSGMELLRQLAPLAPKTAVIMATAVADIETAVAALRLGAYDYVLKPLLPEAIQLSVARALRKRRLELQELERSEQIETLVRERTKALQATQQALLSAMCHMAEFRDPPTGAHLQRVVAYARTLAVELARNSPYAGRIDEAFIAHLTESAPLHDIGKVGVPDRILLKPGKLTPEEFEQMKLHTVYGETICRLVRDRLGSQSAGFIDMAIEVAGSHHEAWDGSGYPAGFVGQEIPLSARIVRLADFYDACRSPRVYRPQPLSREQVMSMVREGAGSMFDPEIVAAFDRSVDKFAEIDEATTLYVPPSI